MLLIGNYDSPFVRRVAVALHHYGLPFERQVISVFQDFDEMLGTNPVGKVPALKLVEGDVLVDSRIILDYLEGMVSNDKQLVPKAEPERRKVLQYEAIALGFAEKAVELRIELYRKKPHARDPEWISRLERQVTSALEWLEKQKPTPYFHGSTLTLPDVTTVVAYTYVKRKLPDMVPQYSYVALEKQWVHCEALREFNAAPYSEAEAQASEF